MTNKSKKLGIAGGERPRKTLVAEMAVKPNVNAASTIQMLRGKMFGGLDIGPLSKELAVHNDALKGGDMSRAEDILLSQAHVLDALFHQLAEHSSVNIAENFNAAERLMRLALKSQNQCQATLRTLGEIKAPKNVAFVKQANIAQNQQVNNNQPKDMVKPRVRKTKNQQNEVLENDDGKRLDGRAEAATERANSELEAVGAVNRTQVL